MKEYILKVSATAHVSLEDSESIEEYLEKLDEAQTIINNQ